MALNAWIRALGTTQGRIAPTVATAIEGSYVFMLGSDVPGIFETLNPGDYAEVAQTADDSGLFFMHAVVQLRPPAAVPAGVAWRFSMMVDGTEEAFQIITPGRTRIRRDLSAFLDPNNPGDHAYSFRLTLTGTGGPYELELPGVAVDAVAFDAPAVSPVLHNRDGEPGETGVLVGVPVSVDITTTSQDSIDLTFTQVWINGIPVFNAGTFAPGYDSVASYYDASLDSSQTLRVVIAPPAPFNSLEVVSVRVLTREQVGPSLFINVLDQTYSFTCQDLTSPVLVSALATDLSTVRLTFSQPVRQQDPTNGADALDPANYTFIQQTAPSVSAIAVSVASVSGIVVDLSTSTMLTPGATYQVIVAGVEDIAGNAIVAPFDRLSFTGFQPQQPPGRSFDLLSFLPKMNVREDKTGDLLKFISCLQEIADLLLFEIDLFGTILDPDTAPEAWVDLMLADLGDPFSFDLALVDKRRLIQVLVLMYREKGTAPGIANVVRFFLGLEITFDYFNNLDAWTLGVSLLGFDTILGTGISKLLYSFTVSVGLVLTPTQVTQLISIVNYMKPAHTHFVALLQPTVPAILDPVELGLSELGYDWILH